MSRIVARIVVCEVRMVENGLRINLYKAYSIPILGAIQTGPDHSLVSKSLDEIFSKDFTDQVQKLLRDGRDKVPLVTEGS